MKFTNKLGVLDVIIIVLVAAALVFGYKKFIYKEKTAESKIVYLVETEEVKESFAKNVRIDGKIFHSIKSVEMGIVKSVENKPHKVKSSDLMNGKIEMIESPVNYNAYIEVEAIGQVTDKDVIVNGEEVKVGIKMPVKGKGYASEGTIVKVNIKE